MPDKYQEYKGLIEKALAQLKADFERAQADQELGDIVRCRIYEVFKDLPGDAKTRVLVISIFLEFIQVLSAHLVREDREWLANQTYSVADALVDPLGDSSDSDD